MKPILKLSWILLSYLLIYCSQSFAQVECQNSYNYASTTCSRVLNEYEFAALSTPGESYQSEWKTSGSIHNAVSQIQLECARAVEKCSNICTDAARAESYFAGETEHALFLTSLAAACTTDGSVAQKLQVLTNLKTSTYELMKQAEHNYFTNGLVEQGRLPASLETKYEQVEIFPNIQIERAAEYIQ